MGKNRQTACWLAACTPALSAIILLTSPVVRAAPVAHTWLGATADLATSTNWNPVGPFLTTESMTFELLAAPRLFVRVVAE